MNLLQFPQPPSPSLSNYSEDLNLVTHKPRLPKRENEKKKKKRKEKKRK
jgi:hypothetical protein